MDATQRDSLKAFLRRSPAGRAAFSIFRQVWTATHTGMTIPAVCWLLRERYPESTVVHDCTALARMRALVWTGGKTRTKQHGYAKVWRAA